MKRNKLYALIVLIMMCCVVLTACLDPFEGYDDDAAIIKCKSFSMYSYTFTKTNSKFYLRCKKAEGVERIKNITVPQNPVFDISLAVQSGRFKVVLIKGDRVFVICDGDTNTDVPVLTQLEAGTYSLAIVAEKAKFSFTFKFNSYR